MGRIGRMLMSAFVAIFFLFGLTACGGGGGGGGGTPVTPTAIYGGAATGGDIFVIKMDYPSTGKATITRSATDGTLIGTKEMTYTVTGNKYTFTDSDSHEFTAFMVPDTMLVMHLPATTEKDIIIAVVVDDTIKTVADLSFFKDHDYILTQFRHDKMGVKWVRSNVDADGVVTGHHANADKLLPIDLDDVGTTNDFPAGMDVDNFVYNAETNGFTLATEDEGDSETWTLYVTKSGMGVIDKGPKKGIRFNGLKGTTTAGIAVGDVFDTLFYGRQSDSKEGTTTGTITVTDKGDTFLVVDVDNGRDPLRTGITITADPSPLWSGFFRLPPPDNAVVQLVGSVALIFAGKHGEWQYEYGIGVKQ
jgi:hypothetical protein